MAYVLQVNSENMEKFDTILVLDFGGQYCHLIARRVRECGVYSEVVPHDVSPLETKQLSERVWVKGIILSGGPSSVYQKDAPKCDSSIFELGVPVLGICYGHQLIAHIFGGKVRPAGAKEFGATAAFIDKPVGLLEGLGEVERVWMSHSDSVVKLPKGWEILAHTENSPIAAFKHSTKPIFGIQWHPEVVHTENGMQIFKNFIFKICGCRPNWTMQSFVKNAVDEIRRVAGNERCIIALSGGVDSSTAAILASNAIGKNLVAVFVDHGFMREGEPEFVKNAFKEFPMRLIIVNSRERFLKSLKGIKDPERKRKIIGREFIRVFEEVSRNVKAKHLVQGTIYPDRIESGFRRRSEKIKTHHNVGGLPTKLKFKSIIEPLKDLYKDEVRKVASELGLKDEITWRQPFPGPGLAVRICGEVTKEKVEVVKKADKIVTEEIERAGLAGGLWQYFAVLTNTRSTGVKGDSRSYGYTIAIRAVESREAMTAKFARIPYEILEKISTRITNEIPQVTRVVYDITHKPPATIEWE
jgi:GMP synthase (glutamine-hydrolysing)